MKKQGKNIVGDARETVAGKTLEAEAGDRLSVGLSVALRGSAWEYFCHGCGQLRLWLRGDEQPSACTHCGSDHIECERPGSERLGALRKKRSGVAPHLDDSVGEALDLPVSPEESSRGER